MKKKDEISYWNYMMKNFWDYLDDTGYFLDVESLVISCAEEFDLCDDDDNFPEELYTIGYGVAEELEQSEIIHGS